MWHILDMLLQVSRALSKPVPTIRFIKRLIYLPITFEPISVSITQVTFVLSFLEMNCQEPVAVPCS